LVEFAIDLVGHIVEMLNHLLSISLGVKELHGFETILVELVSINYALLYFLFDDVHGVFLLGFLRLNKNSVAALVVGNETLHHTNSLRKWAIVIVFRKGILLQEFILDKGSARKSSFLILSQCIFTYELDNFCQITLFLKNLLNNSFVSHEIWVSFVVVIGKHSIVVGVRNGPVDGWEMLSLSKFFVQSPEDLDDIKSG